MSHVETPLLHLWRAPKQRDGVSVFDTQETLVPDGAFCFSEFPDAANDAEQLDDNSTPGIDGIIDDVDSAIVGYDADKPQSSSGIECAALTYNRISLGRSPIPGTDRCLTAKEVAILTRRLQSMSSAPKFTIECGILGLVSLTSRNYEAITYVLAGRSSRHFRINQERGTWYSRLPTSLGQHRDPALAHVCSRNHRVIGLPIPKWIQDCFVGVSPDRFRDLAPEPSDELLNQLIEVVPRFTLARLRAFMPAQVFFTSGDLSLAQMFAGDRLGPMLSDRQLNYFSVAVDEADDLYRTAMEPVFELHERDTPLSATRFGMQFPAVLPSTITEIADRYFPRLPRTPKQLTSLLSAEEIQHVITERLSDLSALGQYGFLIICAGTSLRPSTEACEIPITYFCFRHRFFINGDKRPDLTHQFRVLIMGDDAAEVAQIYVNELGHMERLLLDLSPEHARPDLLKLVQAALTGVGPLFLIFDEAMLRPIKPKDIDAWIPHGLPSNILRHRFETAAREVGIAGVDVSILAGRYILGQPYGNAAFESVIDASDRLRARLTQITRRDGWTVPPSRFRAWSGASRPVFGIECIEALALLKSQLKQNALAAILDNKSLKFSSDGQPRKQLVAETLKAAIPSFETLERDVGVETKVLSVVVRDVLKQMGELTDVKVLAVQSDVNQLLAPYVSNQGWKAPRFRKYPALPDYPAVLPPMLAANAMLQAAEDRLWTRQEARSKASLINRYHAILILRGVIDKRRLSQSCRALLNAQTIAPAYGNRRARRRSRHDVRNDVTDPQLKQCFVLLDLSDDVDKDSSPSPLPDEVEVTTDCLGEQVQEPIHRKDSSVLLGGRDAIAAMEARRALGKQRQRAPGFNPEGMLDELFGEGHGYTLSAVFDLVRMVRPLVSCGPGVLESATGCGINLSAELMRQLLLQSTPRSASITKAMACEVVPGARKSKNPSLSSTTRELLGLTLRSVGEWGSAIKNTEAVAKVVISQLEALSEQAHAQNSRTLGHLIRWIVHLMKRELRMGMKRRSEDDDTETIASGDLPKEKLIGDLRPSSVTRYVSSIVRDMVEAAETLDVKTLEKEALEDLYVEVLMRKNPSSRHYSYARLREFHQFALRDRRIDWVTVSDELPDPVDEPEASIVTTAAFERLMTYFERCSSQLKKKMGTRFGHDRYQLSRVAAILMYRLGLRIGEVARLRFCDIVDDGGELVCVSIETSHLGVVKSRAGNRSLDGGCNLNEQELDLLRSVIEREKARQETAGVFSTINPVFAAPNGTSMLGRDYIGSPIQACLVEATGCPDARPHWLRHTRAQSLICSAISGLEFLDLPTPRCGSINHLPPHVFFHWVALIMGHSSLQTTLKSYFHLFNVIAAHRGAKRLASIEQNRWADGTRRTDSARRVWLCRTRSALTTTDSESSPSIIDPLMLAHDWVLHQSTGSYLSLPYVRRRAPGMMRKLPLPVPKQKKMTVDDGVGFILDAASLRPGILLDRYQLDAQTAVRLLHQLIRWFSTSGVWLVAPSQCHALLVAWDADGLPTLQHLDIEVQHLQGEAIRACLAPLNRHLLMQLADAGVLERGLRHLYQAPQFVELTKEDSEDAAAFRCSGLHQDTLARRHALAIMVGTSLAALTQEIYLERRRKLKFSLRRTSSRGKKKGLGN